MRNGGGPACLRLPISMDKENLDRIRLGSANVLFTDKLYHQLRKAVNELYPETIRAEDLANPELASDAMAALQEIQEIMKVRIIEKQSSRFDR